MSGFIRPLHNTFKAGGGAEDFLIDLGSGAITGLYLVSYDRASFKRIYTINGSASCVSWSLALAVLCHFEECGQTVIRWSMTSYPSEVWRLSSSALGQNTTCCTFINCSGEGGTFANWRFLGADFNTVVGGTAEAGGPGARGIHFGGNTKGNILIGLGCESNPAGDVYLGGLNKKLLNGYFIENNIGIASVTVANFAVSAVLDGVVANSISIVAGAKHAMVRGVSINTKGDGTYTDAGSNTEVNAIYDFSAAKYIYPRKPSFGISVTVGNFTYTNNTGSLVQILIAPGAGGTITQL